VTADEWRVEIDLKDEGHGYSLGERLRAHDLDDEARERLGRRVIVTRDGPRLFLYTTSEEAAREAERVAKELLEADRLTATVRVVRWATADEQWVSTEPGATPTGQRPFEWEVQVHLRGRDEAGELAAKLAEEGLPVHRLWRTVTVDATTADAANALADRLRDELPEAEVTVEPNPEGVPGPAFVWLESLV
jgi:hypothetical protein